MADQATTVTADDATDTTDKTVDTQTTDTTTVDDKGSDKGADKGTDKTPDATDWRTELSGDDPELLKFLGRYHSKDAALKGFRETYGQIRAGKFIKPLGEDPTDEDLAAYRKQMGVPEKPEEYLQKLGDGLVVGDDDRPYVDKFLDEMHKTNARPADVNAALQTYYKIVEEQSAEASAAEAEARRVNEDALREEWGPDFRRNVNIVDSYLEQAPRDVREVLTSGYGPDGTLLANNAPFIKWLAGLALAENPVATVVPGTGQQQIDGVEEEIGKIEKVMRENRKAYNDDAKMQSRLRELYGAREKLGGKA